MNYHNYQKKRAYFQSTFWKEVKIGQRWIVRHKRWGRNPQVLRLIKVTPKGFNLLNERTGQCVLSRHLYPDKKTFMGYDNLFRLRFYGVWDYILINDDAFNEILDNDFNIEEWLLNNKNKLNQINLEWKTYLELRR